MPATQLFKVTEPRDKIFAVIPLISRFGGESIIYYSKSLKDIVFDMATRILSRKLGMQTNCVGKLDSLHFAGKSCHFSNLPSWVPAWQEQIISLNHEDPGRFPKLSGPRQDARFRVNENKVKPIDSCELSSFVQNPRVLISHIFYAES